MIRVVLDTNILVSAYLRPKGTPAAILAAAMTGQFQMCISEAVLAEYREVLHRARFSIGEKRIDRGLSVIRKRSRLCKPSLKLVVSPDEDDNRLLECAHAAKAHYLVTGNTKDFPGRYKYTKIVSPKSFRQMWDTGAI